MSEKQWYEDLPREEIEGKHVRAVLSSGTVIEGRLEFGIGSLITVGSPIERSYILKADVGWSLMEGVERLDLVWDERDWDWVGLDDIEAIDALVVAGRLYELVSHKPDCDLWQVRIPGEKHTASVSTAMISCALRRKVMVPMEPGYYRDRDGGFWKMWLYSDGHAVWQPMLVDIGDTCHMNSALEMKRLMPLTPVHFESGRAA